MGFHTWLFYREQKSNLFQWLPVFDTNRKILKEIYSSHSWRKTLSVFIRAFSEWRCHSVSFYPRQGKLCRFEQDPTGPRRLYLARLCSRQRVAHSIVLIDVSTSGFAFNLEGGMQNVDLISARWCIETSNYGAAVTLWGKFPAVWCGP